MRIFLALLLLCLGSATGATAQGNGVAGFSAFLENEIWPEARAVGVSRRTFEAALAGVQPDLDLPDLVLPGRTGAVAETQHQAEFRSPAAYFEGVASIGAQGQRLLAQHAAVLSQIEARYGVPAPIIVAVWGRESAFGNAAIPRNAFTILATKAYLARRRDMFRAELLAALRIVEEGHRSPREMRSSWAGALGQPQFMPTKFLQLAVDFDGDGRKDIWNSVPDTLASIANYLRQSGWVPGRDWGFEASVPANVSCTLEGPDQGRPIQDFVRAGVSRVSGRPFPANEAGAVGYLLMPAGRFGPAFIATPNFYVLKEYNNSDLYALFIGHAADRMRGGGGFRAEWRRTDSLTRGDVARMQERMVARGMDVGGVDGLAGFKTRRSIGQIENTAGLSTTCWPNRTAAARLG